MNVRAFDYYDEVSGEVRKIGTVTWSLGTRTDCEQEANPATYQSRMRVMPMVQLFRTRGRAGSASPVGCVNVATPGNPQYGNWV